jgi:hypothetical protein
VSSLTIRVSNDLHYWEQDFVLRVFLPISVTTTSLPDAELGVAYAGVLEAFGDVSNSIVYTWTVIDGSLPDGLELHEASGYIIGTPAAVGTWDFTVQVDDSVGKATQELSITVRPAGESPGT